LIQWLTFDSRRVLISILAPTRGRSMPGHRYVAQHLLTIFVYLDDRVTPTKLRLNMSQLIRTFGFDCLTLSESLI
jgi:hypothetical protein